MAARLSVAADARQNVRESAFQSWVIETAELHGWKVWHVGTPMKPTGRQKWVPAVFRISRLRRARYAAVRRGDAA